MKTNKIIDVKMFETYFYGIENKIGELLQENVDRKNFKIENLFTIPIKISKRTDQIYPNLVKETIEECMVIIIYSYEV